MSKLKQALESGRFVFTGEIGPPKGVGLDRCLRDAEMLREHVTAINVTDLQSAVMRIGSLAVSARLVERGLEPVYQLTCRDRNRLALQSDLLSAWALGIENVLCLTGDHPILGDHVEAKPVYDLDSVQLLRAANMLNEGHDMAGHELENSPSFFLGSVVTPAADPLEPQIIKMRKKIEAGTRFFQTQAIYEPDKFESFVNQVKVLNVPIIAGIVVLKSAGMAKFMNDNVAGISVPEGIIQEMEETKKEERKKKAVEITARIIRQVKPFCQGIHIMPLGWDDLVPEIIKKAEHDVEIKARQSSGKTPSSKSIQKILLVDDDPDFVEATKMVLESRSDYRVFTASDGVSAISTAKAEKPDVILLDVIMPFKDGFDTAKELKTDPELSQIPIMMLTSFSQRKGETDASIVQGMETEAEDYVTKPVAPKELLQRVKKLLGEES